MNTRFNFWQNKYHGRINYRFTPCVRYAKARHIIGVLIGRADAFKGNRNPREKIYLKAWGNNLNQHTANIEALIKLLLAENWQVILIGGKQELDVHDALSLEVLNKCVDYVGKTSVAESIALASLCDVVVGIDTGMQHVSDALGVKTVSIFGPTMPSQCGAYSDKAIFAEVNEPCRPCFGTEQGFKCKHRKCTTKITPERVFELIIRQLNSQNKESYKENYYVFTQRY
ncbi:MAG: glycosyltransferase family 9 protein [Synergistaceae bacterium]|nr:glycosyltransferase family 9 protein [Synergistaceae bacterium]